MKIYQIVAIVMAVIVQQILFFMTVYEIFSVYFALSIICFDIFMFGSIIHPLIHGNERKLNLRILLYFILIDIFMFLFVYLTRPDHFPSIF